MTLHVSKGLEFPNVFIVGMEEGLFPTGRAFDDNDPSALEEERRLAYVGMTRARENLFLVYARMRRVWGQEQQHPPSQFISEIPQEYIEFDSALSGPKFLDRFRQQYGGDEAELSPHARSSSGPRNSRSPRPGIKRRAAKDNLSNDFDEMPNYEDFSEDLDSATNDYTKGMRVRHPVFGVGSIYLVEGSGESQKVSIMFNDRTTKKFVAKHARLERLT